MNSEVKPFYVYIHLHPTTNEIFYVGQGKGYRKSKMITRNTRWKEYASQLTEPHKVLVLKDNLDKNQALELEDKIIAKVGIHYSDKLTNIEGIEPSGSRDAR